MDGETPKPSDSSGIMPQQQWLSNQPCLSPEKSGFQGSDYPAMKQKKIAF